MALPQDVLSSQVVYAPFEAPRSEVKLPLEDYDYGGVALSDASQGLKAKVWRGFVDGNDVKFEAPGVSASVIFTEPGITDLAITFDQNGRPFVAYMVGAVAKFRWYDALAAGYSVTTLPAGSKDPRCQLDDKRYSQAQTSDIILAYVRLGTLYTRKQRDRYLIEYAMATGLPAGKLVQVGMNIGNRFQFYVQPGA